MSTYWLAKSAARLLLCAVLLAARLPRAAGQTDTNPKRLAQNVLVARKLAALGDRAKEKDLLLRAYVLYDEAAKQDPSFKQYQKKRDEISMAAQHWKESQLEGADISRDMINAQMEARAELIAKRDAPDEAAPVEKTNERGQEAPPPKLEASPLHFLFPTQVMVYGTYNDVRSNSVFNPQNRLAKFPAETSHLSLRPDLVLALSAFQFSAKPRLELEHPFPGTSHTTEGYLQEWRVRVLLLRTLTVSYGREVLMWGPAMSLPASNPFFINNGRNTPLTEVGARDFGRLIWQPNSHLAFSYIANTALRRGDPTLAPFRQSGALKVDYIGGSFLASVIYSGDLTQPLGPRKFVGGYLQKTLGQSTRIYVDGSAEQGNPTLYPVASGSPLGLGFSASGLTGPFKPRTIVGGLAYTDVKGNTWTGEYIYNPFGYTSLLASSFYSLAANASTAYFQGGALSQLAAAELAESRNPAYGLPLRRNYAFGQYQKNGLPGRFDVVLRYTYGVAERSGQGVAYITWNASNRLQLFVLASGMNGSMNTEFARYLRYQAQAGARFFLH